MTGADERIALVTARDARGTDNDMPPLVAALRAAGAEPHEVDWDDTTVDWSSFDLALLRSTWDYFERLREFLAWVGKVAGQTRLLNPPDVIRWNTDKHYLADLERSGIPVVPSTFVEPGEDAEQALGPFLALHSRPPSAPSLTSGETDNPDFVVKPAIGAGSRDAQRHQPEQRMGAVAHVRRLLNAQRSVIMQPYLDSVDEHGETALLFFDGAFSHAIRKGPLLKRNEGPTAELYAKETISARSPLPSEMDVALRALAAIPFAKPLLYARVDLICGDDGSPRLLELELVEPSVFVDAVEVRLHEHAAFGVEQASYVLDSPHPLFRLIALRVARTRTDRGFDHEIRAVPFPACGGRCRKRVGVKCEKRSQCLFRIFARFDKRARYYRYAGAIEIREIVLVGVPADYVGWIEQPRLSICPLGPP